MKRAFVFLCIGAIVGGLATAGELSKGDNEVDFSVSYNNIDLGVADLEIENSAIGISYGWMLTDNHEVGALLNWTNTELSSEAGNLEQDGLAFGGFYHYNFSTSGKTTPFVGVDLALLSGDLGDLYDYQYDFQVGLKHYFWENAGLLVAASFGQLATSNDADELGLDDADALSLVAGFVIKY